MHVFNAGLPYDSLPMHHRLSIKVFLLEIIQMTVRVHMCKVVAGCGSDVKVDR